MTLEPGPGSWSWPRSSAAARASTGSCSRRCAPRGTPAPVVDGELRRLDEEIELDKKFKHDISIVVDRLVMKEGLRKRLAESIEAASQLGEGLVEVELLDGGGEASRVTNGDEVPGAKVLSGPSAGRRGEVLLFSERFACLPAAPRCPSSSRGSSPSTRRTAAVSAATGSASSG